MSKLKSSLVFLLRILAGIWTLGIALLIISWILVYYEWFAIDSKIMAWGFLPPYIFGLFFLLPVIVFWLTRNRTLSLLLIVIYMVFMFGFGDFSLLKPKTSLAENRAHQLISAAALNVRYYSYGLDKIVKAIQTINADIYLLSENEITAKQLKELKRKIAPKQFFMGRQEGTAIISRFPVLEFKEVLLPSHQASLYYENEIEKQHLNPRRSFVHATIDVNGVIVNAISIRFLAGRAKSREPGDVVRWGFYVLESQVKELVFFADYIRNLKGPVIFGGDLNATPSSFVVRRLSQLATDAYLSDHIWGGFTFWTISPKLVFVRLDYLFYLNNIRAVRSKILNDLVSDHYPVYAQFAIPVK